MQGLLITFGIIVVMSILGYLTQLLKRASDRRQQEQDRERERQRRARAALENPNPNPTRQNDLDRYIRAVEAQRQKPVPVARGTPVPTVQPARKKQRADDVPAAFPPAKARKPSNPAVDDLPMATVVNPPAGVPVATPTKATKPPKPAAAKPVPPASPLARQLVTLLKSPQAPALAVVLHEVLGPPKCRQQPPPPQVTPGSDAGGG